MHTCLPACSHNSDLMSRRIPTVHPLTLKDTAAQSPTPTQTQHSSSSASEVNANKKFYQEFVVHTDSHRSHRLDQPITHSVKSRKRQQKMVFNKKNYSRKQLDKSFGEGFEILQQAATGGFFSLFRILLNWRRSLYAMIWPDILIFLILFYIFSFVYRFGLTEDQMTLFEDVVKMTDFWVAKVPITFLLGFYVSSILSRWLFTYNSIPRMGSFAYTLRRSIQDRGDAARGKHFRVLLSRYVNLAWILGLRPRCADLSERLSAEKRPEETADEEVLRRHLLQLNADPTIQRYYGKMVSPSEVDTLIEAAKQRSTGSGQLGSPDWWLPLQWAGSVVDAAMAQGHICDSNVAANLNAEIENIRKGVGTIINTSERPLPLVYHQVVIIAVYVLYFTFIIARQFLIPSRVKSKEYAVDYYFPIFSVFELMFFVGWFKVAFVLLNPFGDDEEDFKFAGVMTSNLRCCSIAAETPQHLFPAKLAMAINEPEKFVPNDPQQEMVPTIGQQAFDIGENNIAFG